MLRGGEPAKTGDADRGQTNLDFVIGVSIFVVAVIVAVTFVPDLVGGVAGSGQSDGVLADRVASDLANDQLGNASRPGQLRLDCTVSLFSSSMGYCGLGDSVRGNLDPLGPVNVSLVYGERACRTGSEVVPANSSGCDTDSGDTQLDRNVRACYDDATGRIVREDGVDDDPGTDSCDPGSSNDVLLLGGPQPGGNADTSIARRSVRLAGERLILEVRTW